jgi:dynein heavy chain
VVSKQTRPCFGVNITNHVTMVNFNINTESLQAQLLSLVVMNERCDLENAYVENSKEAFDAIKSLKGVEEGLLRQLEVDVEDLLGED